MLELDSNSWEHAHALHHLGYATAHLGNHRVAISYFTQSVEMFTELHDAYSKATVLVDLGESRGSQR
jgi:hypothetical protein